NVVFLHQFGPEDILRLRGLIPHFGDHLTGPYVFFRIAVTVQTPAHLQGFLLIHERHGVHTAVAGFATYALLDVDRVIEVDVVGKVIDLLPLDGLVRRIAVADGFESRTVDPDFGVAVHTSLSGRHHGVRGIFDAGVAVSAIDPHGTDVMGVTERDGLLARFTLARSVIRIRNQFKERSAETTNHQN